MTPFDSRSRIYSGHVALAGGVVVGVVPPVEVRRVGDGRVAWWVARTLTGGQAGDLGVEMRPHEVGNRVARTAHRGQGAVRSGLEAVVRPPLHHVARVH